MPPSFLLSSDRARVAKKMTSDNFSKRRAAIILTAGIVLWALIILMIGIVLWLALSIEP